MGITTTHPFYDPAKSPSDSMTPVLYYGKTAPSNASQQAVIQAYHSFIESPKYPGTPAALLAAALTYFNGVKAGTIIPSPINEGSWFGIGVRDSDNTEGRAIVARFLSQKLDPENPTDSSYYDAFLAHIAFVKAKWGVV